MSVPGTQTNLNDNAFYFAPNGGGGGGGGVTSIVAGTGIGISPAGGTGAVTITNSRVSDPHVNSIQLSDGNGGFTSVNAATITPATGTLSLGNGSLLTQGVLRSAFDPTASPIVLPNGNGFRGSFGFSFTINGGDGSITNIDPLNALGNGAGGMYAVSCQPANSVSSFYVIMLAAGDNKGVSVAAGNSNGQFYFQTTNAGVIYVATQQGSGAQTGSASFNVTKLV